jgi:outer membrane protein insertion porin family
MVDVVFTIREHAKVKIQRVEFIGNNNIPSKELKKIIGTQEGSLLSFLTGRGTFAQEMFEQDLQRLEFYYNTKGFAEVRFEQPIVSLSRDRKFIQIVITVHEGPQYKVGEVSVEGDLLLLKKS